MHWPVLLLLLLNLCLAADPASVSGVIYAKGSSSTSGFPFPKRIEFQTVTVDDFSAASTFYIDILGAVPMDDEPVTYSGTSHYNAMFTSEERQILDDKLPNIKDDGNTLIQSQFLILGNGIIQLIQFIPKPDQQISKPLTEPMTSPCWIGAAHIDFWIADHLDMNDFIEKVEAQAKEKGFNNVAWNRPVVQRSREDQETVPKSQYANKVPNDGNPFGGLEWSYFKGPVGEQLELYKIVQTMKDNIAKAYCSRGAVSSAFTDDPKTSADVVGIFQHGFRTDNLHASVGFYTQVLGGDLIDYPVHGMDIRGDDAHWMILANETIEAFEFAESNPQISKQQSMDKFGVANISSTGTDRLDHRFILFDNFVIEPLLYTRGKTFGGDGFNPRWDHMTSQAYIGSITGAFSTPSNDLTLSEFVNLLSDRAETQGFRSAIFPTETASFPSSHPYFGLEYGYGKGPAGEAINYIRIDETFKQRMEISLLKANGVSTAFESTSKSLQMEAFCN